MQTFASSKQCGIFFCTTRFTLLLLLSRKQRQILIYRHKNTQGGHRIVYPASRFLLGTLWGTLRKCIEVSDSIQALKFTGTSPCTAQCTELQQRKLLSWFCHVTISVCLHFKRCWFEKFKNLIPTSKSKQIDRTVVLTTVNCGLRLQISNVSPKIILNLIIGISRINCDI